MTTCTRTMPTLTPTDSLLERLPLIPDELVERGQWVVWRDEPVNGKVPHCPRQPVRRAKVNDPATWATFDEAVTAFADYLDRADRFTGIGYVFSADDPFVGVDLDGCVTGDAIHPAAKAIIDSIPGYAEISPSTTGVKIWTRAVLTAPRHKVLCVWGDYMEVYDRGRWFAATGWRIDR